MPESIAIDLGTANTLIIHNGKVVIDSPSIVARDRTTGKIIATGKEASLMQGKTHENIKTIRPLKDGVIADFQASEEMIKEFVKKIPAIKKKFFPPALRMVICIPSGITEVEKRAVQDSARHMNAKEIYLIYEPMAAAIGVGIDIMEPKGNMVIDIGGGTTEIAVIALAGIVCDQSVKVAGDLFTNDIMYYMRTQHNLYVGETTAEKVKLAAITGTNTGDQDLSGLATNTALALKANTSDVNTSLALKANAADVTTSLALKANTSDVNTSLALKANAADVTTSLALKANTSDLANKVDKVTGKELSTNDYTTAEKAK